VSGAAVHVTSPAPDTAWREVHAGDDDALVTQSPEWTRALCAGGRYDDVSRLYDLPGGRRAVLPLVRRRALPGPLAPEASLPESWGMGGLVASGGVRTADVAAVFADLAARPALRISIRPSPLHTRHWDAARPRHVLAVPRLAHVLDLDGGFGAVWAERFSGTARTAVRKAQRSGVMVERDSTGRLLPVFYALWERSVDRWAAQQHEPRRLARWRAHRRDPYEKLEVIARALAEMCLVWVAWHDGDPVAALIVLQGANAHYTRGAMDKDRAGPTRANYLLHQLAIENACAAGCRRYHMGESGTSASLAQFKTRFGARAHPYAEYRLERVPITAADACARTAVKRAIRFRD
jgi:hypothetical protein